MSVLEFKRKIASKYETTLDNVVLSYEDKEFRGDVSLNQRGLKTYNVTRLNVEDESMISLRAGLDLNERSIVKVTFKVKPLGLKMIVGKHLQKRIY